MKGIISVILSLINLLNILFYNIDLVQGIQNGMIPQDQQFAYQVSIFINGEYACGGAALNRRSMLSAASCVVDEAGAFLDVKFEIVAGVTNFDLLMRKIKVFYIYIHKDFRPLNRSSSSNRRSYPNTLEQGDLSILNLAINIPNEIYVTFVRLPVASLKFGLKTPEVAGFGRTQPYTYVSSSNLSNLPYRRSTAGRVTYIKTRVEKITKCQTHYPDFGELHICTQVRGYGDNPAGACLGDVGSPLVFENAVIGVLQIYSPNCDETVTPAVYTRTSSFLSFIRHARDGIYESDMRLGDYSGAHVREVPNPHPDLDLHL